MIPQITIYRCTALRSDVDDLMLAMNDSLASECKCSWVWAPQINSVGVTDVTSEFHSGMESILGTIQQKLLTELKVVPPSLVPVVSDVYDFDTGELLGQEANYEIIDLWVQI